MLQFFLYLIHLQVRTKNKFNASLNLNLKFRKILNCNTGMEIMDYFKYSENVLSHYLNQKANVSHRTHEEKKNNDKKK